MRFVEIQSLIRYFFLSRLSLFVSPLMKGRRWNIQGILTVPSFRFKSIEVFAVVRTLVKITQGSSHPNFQGSPIFRGPLLLVSGRIGLRGYRTRGAIPRLWFCRNHWKYCKGARTNFFLDLNINKTCCYLQGTLCFFFFGGGAAQPRCEKKIRKCSWIHVMKSCLDMFNSNHVYKSKCFGIIIYIYSLNYIYIYYFFIV